MPHERDSVDVVPSRSRRTDNPWSRHLLAFVQIQEMCGDTRLQCADWVAFAFRYSGLGSARSWPRNLLDFEANALLPSE